MAKGKPYLATWASNVLSLWRMDTNDVFQPVANVALASSLALAGIPFSFAAGFTDDSQYLGVAIRDAAASVNMRSYSTTALGLISNNNISTTNTSFSVFMTRKGAVGGASATIDTTVNGRKVNPASGALVAAASLRSQAFTPNYAEPAVHPNLSYVIRPRSNQPVNTGLFINYNTAAVGVAGYPDYTSSVSTGASTPTIQSVAAAWSPGGDLIYFLDTAGAIQVVPFNTPATLTPSSAQVIAAVGAIASTVPANGLGYNGTTYTTVIYQRTGSTLTEIQRIGSFGKAGAFTEDSMFIVDANSKKAYKLNLTLKLYEDVSATAMANVPISPFGFLSNDIDAIEGIANVYNAAIGEFLSCGVDLANLKMIFLSPSASFNAAATTITGAINGFAVSDPNVPATGLTLQNATLTPGSGGQVLLKADDLAVNVANNFTFRYSALVDATNDTPLAFFDWGEDFTIDALSGVNIDLSSRGIVLFGV
jgi:hypothetical protein